MKHIQAKKSLGQNFLKSQKALKAMVVAGEVVEGDTIVEIGPGKGALTKVLLETGATVVAFEKDHRLIELLEEQFKEYIEKKKFFLYEKDILEVDISSLVRHPHEHHEGISIFMNENKSNGGPVLQNIKQSNTGNRSHKLLQNNFNRIIPSGLDSRLRGNDNIGSSNNRSYKLIANIPYYITGEITRRFLTTTHKPQIIVLLVQKEVAQRIVDTKETILSLSVKLYGTPKKIMTVKKEFFSPVPKVDSAIIQISNIKNPFSNKEDETIFFKLIKKAFGQKRKKLNTTLKEYKEQIKNWEEIKDKRPEDLGVEEWKNIIFD